MTTVAIIGAVLGLPFLFAWLVSRKRAKKVRLGEKLERSGAFRRIL